MHSLSEMSAESSENIKALLFDLDGTFITEDNLKAETYNSLEKIKNRGIKTIAVTGRPAGWCDLIARWWPVDAVIGENGAFTYFKEGKKIIRKTFHDSKLQISYQNRLRSLFEELLSKYDYLKLASDQIFRHWDIAIDIDEQAKVSMDIATDIVNFCKKRGANAAISNVHVNIWFGDYNKEHMSLVVLQSFGINKNDIIYIGDSPNDSPMFGCFPLSVGVSSVSKYSSLMENLPHYITRADSGKGFSELINFILSTR